MISAPPSRRVTSRPAPDDDRGRTQRGIGSEWASAAVEGDTPRPTPDPAVREAERWLAVVGSGLAVVDAVPVLNVARGDVHWDSYDDVEAHLLLRADTGCTLRDLIEQPPYERALVLRALGHLLRAGLLRIAS
jgi:hypothetical protein